MLAQLAQPADTTGARHEAEKYPVQPAALACPGQFAGRFGKIAQPLQRAATAHRLAGCAAELAQYQAFIARFSRWRQYRIGVAEAARGHEAHHGKKIKRNVGTLQAVQPRQKIVGVLRCFVAHNIQAHEQFQLIEGLCQTLAAGTG